MRYQSIDFFRGMVICFMIIVNTAGTWEYVYAPLKHAVWHGFTPTDWVFPSFVFIIGVSMWFSFEKYGRKLSPELTRKIIKRTAILFAIGLLLNKFPLVWLDWGHWRIMGVPQRLALCYGIGSFLCLSLSRKSLLYTGAGLLLLYWAILKWMGVEGLDPLSAEGSAVLRLDRWILGENHLYREEVRPGVRIPFDPEGILSTIPAIVTVIIGWVCGELMTYRAQARDLLTRDLLFYGILCGFIGLGWDLFFPINKKLWTSSYVLCAGGVSMIFFAMSVFVVDVLNWRNGLGFFLALGSNALFAYVLSEGVVGILNAVPVSVSGSASNLYHYIYVTFFKPLDPTYLGSFLFALAFMLFCWLICRILYTKKIFIKI